MLFQGAAWEAGGSARPSGTILSTREQGQILPPSPGKGSLGIFLQAPRPPMAWGEQGDEVGSQHKASPHGERALASQQRVNGCLLSYFIFFFFNFLNPHQPLWASSPLSFMHRAAKPQGCYVRMDGRTGRPCHHPQTSKAAPGGRHHHRDGIRDTLPPFHQG